MNDASGLLGGIAKGLRFLGFLLAGLGVVVILAPTVAGAAVAVVLGLVLLLAGIAVSAFGYQAYSLGKGPFGLVAGGFAVACGLALLFNPVSSLSTVTSLVAVYLVVQGIAEVLLGLRLMPEDGWVWVVVDAAASVLLGLSIWMGWPFSGIRAVGFVLGVKLVSAGAVLVRIEKTMHRLFDRATTLRARLTEGR
jgi:uncharacterized membrane protein HdeD (DUF308 family)